MDSLTPLTNQDSLQDRINRMNAWKESQRKADEEFIRRQKIRMFIQDCDEIRPILRNQMLRDSKLCQLEQIYDQNKRSQQMRDFNEAWHEVLIRDYQAKTDKEKSHLNRRHHENLAVHDYLKFQMSEEKLQRDIKIHDEISKELEQIAIEKKELSQQEVEKMRNDCRVRKALKGEILKQIDRNNDSRKKQSASVLKLEQINNEQVRQELMKDEERKKSDQEHFKREVFHYLDYLRKSRHQFATEEREKEKLIEDIRRQKNEDDWKRHCELHRQRLLVNQHAREGQRMQLEIQNKLRIKEAANEKEENLKFNERETNERIKLKEEKWKHRISSYHYGKELQEQRKNEELRDLAEKQKLDEQLKLMAIERDRCEKMGLEFVKSNEAENILPMHPNLRIIKRGKIYQ